MMKHQKELALSITCLLLAFFCSMIWLKQAEENLAGHISPSILRFHVLANSNSGKDQEAKLKVKGFLLKELEQSEADSKEEFCQYVTDQKETLEQETRHYMESLGFPYDARIEVTKRYFPAKAYGDILLPRGTYDTVEVCLGEGRGRNWWCVLYPRLCFVDATHAIVPESSKAQLKALLDPEDYEAILDKKELSVNIRFLSFELAKNFLSPHN